MSLLIGLSVIVCLVGVIFRISTWFSQGIRPSAASIPTGKRVSSAASATMGVLFSPKIIEVIKSFFLDILFQFQSFDRSLLRWSAHFLIFSGFILLFFLHALGDSDPTINPYIFLRNLFGLMVLVGVGLAIYRRISWKSLRMKSYASDWAALIFLAVIMVSGFMLEGTKISSFPVYQNMVEEYGDVDEEEELALEAYWVAKNGVQSPSITKPIDPALIEQGLEVHENNCMDCHASTRNAFVSFSASKIMGPLTSGSEGAVNALLYLHILACLTFLVWLPFSKMFHIISAPVSLITRRIMGLKGDNTANILNRQMVGLSACTHCGSCTVECSAVMYFESFQNDFILPSEKIQFLKQIAAGKEVDAKTLKKLQKGLYVCTSCDRCSSVCPSGINLREIFVSSRYYLLEKGTPETSILSHFSFPLALAQKFTGDHLKALKAVEELFKSKFKTLSDMLAPITLSKAKGVINDSYKSCYTCQRCTNICPVVRSYENPGEVLDMLPHQIIYSLGIGNSEIAMGSQMIWSCSTCYLCQEHCPNQVELCDIFYSLKNGAINKIEAGDK